MFPGHPQIAGPRAGRVLPTSDLSTVSLGETPALGCRNSRAWLTDEIGRVYYIDQAIRLGRSLANDCPLPEQGVSRRHVVIERDSSGTCWLQDLDSTNGTFLNVGRVEREARLRDGDRIRIGRFELVFHQAEVPTADSSRTTSVGCGGYRREPRWLLLADIERATGLLLKNRTKNYRARLSRWLGTAQKIIERHYGSIHEFVGGGFFAWWPDVAGIESEVVGVLQALRSEEAIGPFAFRLALHCGEVLVAERALAHRAGVCGEAIYYLFRLEKVARRLLHRDLLSNEAGGRLRPSLPELVPLECEVPDFGSRCLFTAPPEMWLPEPRGPNIAPVPTAQSA